MSCAAPAPLKGAQAVSSSCRREVLARRASSSRGGLANHKHRKDRCSPDLGRGRRRNDGCCAPKGRNKTEPEQQEQNTAITEDHVSNSGSLMCMRGIAAELGSWPNAEDARWYLYFDKDDSSGGLRVTLSDPLEPGTEKPSSQKPFA